MNKFFPSFKMYKMPDGRLYWRGKINPTGNGGSTWDLQIIYDHEHPFNINNKYGGTIDVYPVSPKLEDIIQKVGSIPHVYYNSVAGKKEYYICTVRPQEFKNKALEDGMFQTSSAATCLGWACKWIVVFELWLNGNLGDEAFEHTY